MMHKFVYYQDPGHGWVAVKRELIDALGLAKQITAYSYQRGQTVYLEEDCDAPLFINTLRERGETVVLRSAHTDRNSHIRGYARFAA